MPDFRAIQLPALRRSNDDQAKLATSYQLYLMGNEALRVNAWCALAGVTVRVRVRYIKPDGSVSQQEFGLTPTSNRAKTTAIFPLGECIVTNTIAFTEGSTVRIGQVFLSVEVVTGFQSIALSMGALLQGFVTAGQALAWPGSPLVSSLDGGGYLRYFNGTTPAAASPVLESVPSGARWELISLRVELTTDANAGTRVPLLFISSGGATSVTVASVTHPAASQTSFHTWAQGLPYEAETLGGYAQNALPVQFPMLAGDSVSVTLVGVKAGDQYSQPVLAVREWLEAA